MRGAMGRGRRAALTAAVAAGLVAAAGAGCGGGAAPASDAGDAGSIVEDDAAVGEMDAAPDWPPSICPAASGDIQNAACNDQVPDGPCIDQIRVDDSAPAPAGGTLVAGVYDLVERIAYTSPGGAVGPAGAPKQETFALAGSGVDFTISSAALSAATATRQVAAAVLASAQFKLTVTATCPAPADAGTSDGGGPAAGAPAVYYYTASEATLTLYRIGAAGPVQADRYVRR